MGSDIVDSNMGQRKILELAELQIIVKATGTYSSAQIGKTMYQTCWLGYIVTTCSVGSISSPLIYVVLFCGSAMKHWIPMVERLPMRYFIYTFQTNCRVCLWLGHHFLQKTIQGYTHHGPDLHINAQHTCEVPRHIL